MMGKLKQDLYHMQDEHQFQSSAPTKCSFKFKFLSIQFDQKPEDLRVFKLSFFQWLFFLCLYIMVDKLCTQIQVALKSFLSIVRIKRGEQGSSGVLFCSNCAMFETVTRPQRRASCDLNNVFVVSVEKYSVNRCDIN